MSYSVNPSSPEKEPKLSARSGTPSPYLYRPASDSPEMIVKLIDQGLSVARLNFNHGDHEKQFQIVKNVREALALRKSGHVSILVDLKGPTIRTGYNEDASKLITLKKGQLL